jgi:hypothetical protein
MKRKFVWHKTELEGRTVWMKDYDDWYEFAQKVKKFNRYTVDPLLEGLMAVNSLVTGLYRGLCGIAEFLLEKLEEPPRPKVHRPKGHSPKPWYLRLWGVLMSPLDWLVASPVRLLIFFLSAGLIALLMSYMSWFLW